jgi:phosphatidylglycerophosphatase A
MKSLLVGDAQLRRVALKTPVGFLALGLGSGLSRYAPGTAGTVVAVPLGLLLKQLPPSLFWIALTALFLAGIPICGAAARMIGRDDPGNIVWDEMVGFWLTVALLPVTWAWWLAGFLAFRFFDILKPWPIRRLEKQFGGGLGIMLDDVLAGAYAMLLLALAQKLLQSL